jgi:Chaperone of endosialidase
MNCESLRALLLIPLLLGCFALSPKARAVEPPPVGGYSGQNTATGEDALFSLTLGTVNTAIGYHALHNCTLGFGNTAVGYNALSQSQTTDTVNSVDNTAVGSEALERNRTGQNNTGVGQRALAQSTTGTENTALGEEALYNNFTGSYNIAIGVYAGLNCRLSNNIMIGNKGNARDSGSIRIGDSALQSQTYIAGISGVTIGNGVAVMINSDGQLGTLTSSARYKEAIKPMGQASEAILALKPVTFCYKYELDPEGIPQFGLVAEQVEKVNPDLVARDEQGKAYTVRYEAVNAMLLNEFLKEHNKVEKLEATVAQQRKDFEVALTELKRQFQKVSAQVELIKAIPQTVSR